jgi:hypothetical protein
MTESVQKKHFQFMTESVQKKLSILARAKMIIHT